jgi:Protein of unknown function (DUF3102)
MTTAVKQLQTPLAPMASPTRELVVVPSAPTLDELRQLAQKAHDEVERALQTAIERGIEAGSSLRQIKKQLPHGNFEDFVAKHFTFTMGTAQKYMRLAKQEAKLRQLIEQRRSAGLHLGMREAVKFLNRLTAEEKPKPPKLKKPKAEVGGAE